MKNVVNNNSGFTIMEMLVALALTSILLLSGAAMLAVGSTSYDMTTKETNLQSESQTTLNFINNLLMKAEYIEYNNGTTKKRYMVDLEANLPEESSSRKGYSKEYKRIIGDTISGYTYIAVATDINVDDKVAVIMNFVVYKDDKLYFYKTTADEMVVEGVALSNITTALDNSLKDKKTDAIQKALNGGNKYLLTNYVNTSDGWNCTFNTSERKNDSGDKVLDSFAIATSLKLINDESKFESTATVIPRNKFIYIY